MANEITKGKHMEAAEVLKDWNLKTKNKQAAAEWWDSMAEGFGERPIPTFEDNGFLQLLEREKMIGGDARVLDVGCGAGGHALAIAARVSAVTGLDLSRRMIEAARRKATEMRAENVRFDVADWHGFHVEKQGFGKAFDLVYAHMTPAVQSYETFGKLCRCSRGWCAMVKPVKRADAVYDAVRALAGTEEGARREGGDILNAFVLLFAQEQYPMIEYNRRRSEMKHSVEQAASAYINRIKTTRALTGAQEARIRDYLASIARDGVITAATDTTTATLYWHV